MGERKSGDLITPNPQPIVNTGFLDLALLYPMDKQWVSKSKSGATAVNDKVKYWLDLASDDLDTAKL